MRHFTQRISAVVAALVVSVAATPLYDSAQAAGANVISDQSKKDFAGGRFQVPATACAAAGDPSPCCTGSGAGATCPTYKMALHTNTAACSTSMTTQAGIGGEVAAAGGYTTGGAALPGFAMTVGSNHANVTFTTPVTWSAATITARVAVIYCATNCQALDAVGCWCLDGAGGCAADTVSTGGPFTVTIPSPVYYIATGSTFRPVWYVASATPMLDSLVLDLHLDLHPELVWVD